MAKYPSPNVPFVEARNVGTLQKPTAIVLSISFTTSEKGAALGIATYHHSSSAPAVSHHYIVDEADTYRCVPDDIAASQNPYKSLSVLLCTQPQSYTPYWDDSVFKVLDRAADLVADLCLIYKIPVRYLDVELEKKWTHHKWRRRGGIIVRAVGTWPYDSFLAIVQANVHEKTLEA